MNKKYSPYDRALLALDSYIIDHELNPLKLLALITFTLISCGFMGYVTIIEPLVTVIIIVSLLWLGGAYVLVELWLES